PEQARGDKVDVRSDVYSLGLTLYELLTDRRPFESESVYETLRRVQEIDPPAMRQIDRKIADDLEIRHGAGVRRRSPGHAAGRGHPGPPREPVAEAGPPRAAPSAGVRGRHGPRPGPHGERVDRRRRLARPPHHGAHHE